MKEIATKICNWILLQWSPKEKVQSVVVCGKCAEEFASPQLPVSKVQVQLNEELSFDWIQCTLGYCEDTIGKYGKQYKKE